MAAVESLVPQTKSALPGNVSAWTGLHCLHSSPTAIIVVYATTNVVPTKYVLLVLVFVPMAHLLQIFRVVLLIAEPAETNVHKIKFAAPESVFVLMEPLCLC